MIASMIAFGSAGITFFLFLRKISSCACSEYLRHIFHHVQFHLHVTV